MVHGFAEGQSGYGARNSVDARPAERPLCREANHVTDRLCPPRRGHTFDRISGRAAHQHRPPSASCPSLTAAEAERANLAERPEAFTLPARALTQCSIL